MIASYSGKTLRLPGRVSALALLFGVLALGFGRGARADTYTVSNINDSGAGTLRQAITDANAHAGADKIVFTSGLSGRLIPLTSLPVLSDDVEIDGPGADLLTITAFGEELIGIFKVDSSVGSGPTVTISGLNLTGGSANGGGGGIKNVHGNVTVLNCTFLLNTTDNLGGAIYNAGTMVLTGCTLDSNSAAGSNAPGAQNITGGGIYNTGTLSMTQCTLSDNNVHFAEAAAGQSTARGGGIYNTGTLNVSHCTFVENLVTLTIVVDILPQGFEAGQGGSLYNTGTVTLDNTIFLDALYPATNPFGGGTLVNAGGTVVSHGYNLTNDGANGLLTGTGDRVSTTYVVGPLQDNGGPTQTHQPQSGSAAIDNGDPAFTSLTATDQRGRPRIIGAHIDIGAVEYRPPFDFDGDGHNDLLFQNLQTGQIAAWYMNGLNVQSGGAFGAMAALGWKVVGVADFNYDGYPDLLFQNSTTMQLVVWYMRNSVYIGGDVLKSPPASYRVIGVGDFNGDGRPDIIFADSSTNNVQAWILNKVDFRIQVTVLQVPGGLGSEYREVGVGDFNHDGKPDILFQSRLNGQLVVWYLNGTTYIGGSAFPTMPDSGWLVQAVGDYNNDGWPDLVFQNATTGKLVVWFMNGLSFAGGDPTSLQPQSPYQIVGPH